MTTTTPTTTDFILEEMENDPSTMTHLFQFAMMGSSDEEKLSMTNASLIMWATVKGKLDVVKELVKSPSGIDEYAIESAFESAIGHGQLHIIEWLFEQGYTVPENALVDAVSHNRLNVVKWLVSNVNYDPYDIEFVLKVAEEYEYDDIATYLKSKN